MPPEHNQRHLILASASPRRLELLRTVGFEPTVWPADVPEACEESESAEHYVARLAEEKATAVAAMVAGDSEMGRISPFVLAADTVVVVDGRILEKPCDAAAAMHMLLTLGERTHHVFTGVAVRDWRSELPPVGSTIVVKTAVTFGPMTREAAALYVATGEPMDKAGAYGVQGIGGAFVRRIEGSYTNVVGLPIYETVDMLRRVGAVGHFPFPDSQAKPEDRA